MRSSLLVAFVLFGCSLDKKLDPSIDAPMIGDAKLIDTPDGVVVDARLCFGLGFGAACLPVAPSAPLQLPITQDFNTGVDANCTHVVDIGGVATCMLAGTTVTLASGTFRAIGTRPLVIVASDTMMIGGNISVTSVRNAGSGAGAASSGCATPLPGETDAGGAGGGAGGSFMGRGGNGGVGDTNDNGGPAGTGSGAVALAPLATAPMSIRAGCSGSDGGVGNVPQGVGADGGGVVYLIAGNAIQVTGSVVAGGAGGGNGDDNSGGGGGGSGGLIGFDAPMIVISGAAAANGGGGGEGGGFNQGEAGTPGNASANRAPGGSNNTNGGDGGAGSGGAISIGDIGGDEVGGGGGGGGGEGYIYVKGVLSGGGTISPPHHSP